MAKLVAKKLNPVQGRLRAAIDSGASLSYNALNSALVHSDMLECVEKAAGTEPFLYLDEAERAELRRLVSEESMHVTLEMAVRDPVARSSAAAGLHVFLAYIEAVGRQLERQELP
jgi:hypothetical protein